MDYEITPERQAYLDARGHIILTACPGSGKTTSIVKKLYSVANYCAEQYGKHAGFACLSFTNKACAELKDKYRDMHGVPLDYPNIVATIDSFIMQCVVLPFWYLCPYCSKKPLVINEKELLDKIYFHKTYQNGELKEYIVGELRQYNRFVHKKTPSKVSIESDDSVKWDNNPVTDPNEINYCKAVLAYRFGKGFINSSDALWIACYILFNHPEVSRIIVNRYPYIIVDEAQDNSELHFCFFQLLKQAGLNNLEFVGDICQSIYGFRNARPELLQNMMRDSSWQVLPLTECRRSNQRIINLYSKLKSADLPAIRSHQVLDMNLPIIVYKYNDDNIRDIINDFNRRCNEYGQEKRVVLARGLTKCKQLAGVKDLKFKYWKSEIPYLLIDAVFAFDDNDMDAAFRKVRQVLGMLKHSDDHEARRIFIQDIERSIDYNTRIYCFIKQIPSFSLSFENWSAQTAQFLHDFWELDSVPVFEAYQRKTDIQGRRINEIARLPVEEYHQSNQQDSDFSRCVNTIHGVKGATMDAVLLFLSENSRGESISLRDFPPRPVSQMNESQRLIYVACSRAKQFLSLAVPSNISDAEINRSFSGLGIVIKNVNLQTELEF